MGYNDNDAQDQNLHLVWEQSSKVSPVLHPYTVPKFDFDHSQHGHLRFDSVVENEAFLGITIQEDNHWIEEYSRGTNAIQFNSSVVESIRKNVWSEATSSESVEMLLKSVGQEEKVLEVMDPNTQSKIPDSPKSEVQNLFVNETENCVASDGQFEINNVGKTSNKVEAEANNDLEVHTHDSNDESQPLKPDAITMDRDFTSNERADIDVVEKTLESQTDVEPSLSVESLEGVNAMTQRSESNLAVLTDAVAAVESSKLSCSDTQLSSGTVVIADNVTEDQPRSPILGVSLLNNDNKEKTEVGLSSDGSFQKDPLQMAEKETVSDVVEKVVHNLTVHCDPQIRNVNEGPRQQTVEDNSGSLLDPKESTTGEDDVEPLNLAVNMSGEQQASVDLTGPPSDKPQISSFSDSQNIKLSQSAKDKHAISPLSNMTNDGNALQLDPVKDSVLVSPQTPSSAATEAGVKGNSERKPRKKSVGRVTVKKSNHMKETTTGRSPGRLEKSPNQSVGQSFTDGQQMQLRAQILVYGSFISGIVPEEPHMIAAFGLSDGGKRAWHAAWLACLERARGQKSRAIILGTPTQSQSGNTDPNKKIKIGSVQSKVISSPIICPVIPNSSPLWNISTPNAMPRNAFHDFRQINSQRVQNITGNNPPWLSHGPFPGQSPIAPFSARFSVSPITEAVKLTTVKESGPPGLPVVPSTGQTVPTGQPLTNSKNRKRKKVAASVAVSEPSFPWSPQTNSETATTPAVMSTPVSTHGDQNIENISKFEESKVQAAEAAVQAAIAVSNCEDVWRQLARQKNLGLVSDEESKLASSAVAISAAASVAKVAAAAAKIVSNVAERARLMADEVFSSNKTENNDQINNNSIISAAKEAARRRIEAASTASKHAENLDAIVKAAELAAEAVSQTGIIVTMGNPLLLKQLVEAGPDGYWKIPQLSNQNIIGSMSESIKKHENNKSISRGRKGADLSKTVRTSDVDQNTPQSTSGTWKENIIKEGCFVEVYKDDNKNKGAWFAANVLTLKDGKAFVCYTEIQSNEGSGKLKEWIPLEVEGSEAPRIRVAHPITTLRFEGNRKRGRMTDYAWCSGDRVDVWAHNSWCEALVIETNKSDVTFITVQIPAQGETLVVRSWHVRPTLIWKDGKWIESSSLLKGFNSSEGDTRHEKRQKFTSPVMKDKQKDKLINNVDPVDSVSHQESRILPLSTQESSFNVGKSSRNENKLETRKTTKNGLQKERSKVVFGVPKPGKKQKFMDVSTRFVADVSNKNNSKKPPIPSVKTLAQKDKPKSAKSTSCDDNAPGQQSQVDFSENAKEKNEPGDRKATKDEVKEKSTSEGEPRRSNRRIQPTSRLLEGLQSSLTISKMPTFSHASQQSHNKVTSKGSTNPS